MKSSVIQSDQEELKLNLRLSKKICPVRYQLLSNEFIDILSVIGIAHSLPRDFSQPFNNRQMLST